MDNNQSPRRMTDVQVFESGSSNIKIKVGAVCPDCSLGILDYDGMLNLVCPTCGYTAGGCFT